ncbi:LysR substrate-binding domain-containing protein [Paraburkholderia sp. J63]|uniref:LysR substrate-binding domain-containing protein n=1 Tax=Paraburkholderia sp. J63 TaxID=2805434 RepID=UPI002ABE477A|nr:LysR substrate-binding domain-containing protein [Paraburkholderia sp. J63]
MKRLPSLTAVRYFEVAARLQSFTAAAAELHVTQGAISRMIQTLEEQLEVRLFERNGRWISLTPVGRTYHEQITAGLNQIAEAGSRLKESADQSTLILSVNVGFTLWLVQNISEFRARYPDIQVDVLAEELKELDYDAPVHARIRYGSPPWPGYDSICLLDTTVAGVVCSPCMKQQANVHEPADLLTAPLLSVAGAREEPWQNYFEHYGLRMPSLGKSPRFLQMLMMREAAMSGLGFGLVPLFLFQQDFRDGRLVQAIPHTCAIHHGYHLLYHKGEDLNPRLKIFKKWLLARLQASIRSDDMHSIRNSK